MVAAGGVSARFGRWVAETAPGLVASRAGLALVPAAAAYLFVAARLGLKGPSQWALAVVVVALPVTSPVVRRLSLVLLPFAILAAVYDWLGIARSFVATSGVHVDGPYLFDKMLFGVGTGPQRLSLNELFANHHWAAVDLVTGCAYLSYVFAVAGFAIFLALADRTPAGAARTRALGWTFLGVNLASFVVYLLCPVAPPWYVASARPRPRRGERRREPGRPGALGRAGRRALLRQLLRPGLGRVRRDAVDALRLPDAARRLRPRAAPQPIAVRARSVFNCSCASRRSICSTTTSPTWSPGRCPRCSVI